jgi:hypothetical protein
VIHVRALSRFRKAQRRAPKIRRRHCRSPARAKPHSVIITLAYPNRPDVARHLQTCTQTVPHHNKLAHTRTVRKTFAGCKV